MKSDINPTFIEKTYDWQKALHRKHGAMQRFMRQIDL